MAATGKLGRPNRHRVFLNVPFDKSYEKQFVALISALIALGRTPHCVLEVADTGAPRLLRILKLIATYRVSIHDLSRAGSPARFNLPFELGIAFALSSLRPPHDFIIFEAQGYRLDVTASDLKGIDPRIHDGKVTGVISCVLDALGKRAGNPSVEEVKFIYRRLWQAASVLKRKHGRETIFSRSIFLELVAAAIRLASVKGLSS
jgi:hypothetical protein